MRAYGRHIAIGAGVVAALALPMTGTFASETSIAATIDAAGPAPLSVDMAVINLDESAVASMTDQAEAPAAPEPDQTAAAELDCMAKAVVHEAGNQPRAGQLAVAQLIMNRVASGRFADTVCGVINQPGQFFSTARYNPSRDTAQWASAMAVARDAHQRVTASVVPGAMFFHAAYQAPTRFFRTRARVAALGDHVFYR